MTTKVPHRVEHLLPTLPGLRYLGKRSAHGATPVVLCFEAEERPAERPPLAELLEGTGAVVAAIRIASDDVATGVRLLHWVHERRTQLGGNGAQVFIAGEEGSGPLAADVAAQARHLGGVAGLVLVAPDANGDAPALELMSTLVLTSHKNPRRDDIDAYARRLRLSGARVNQAVVGCASAAPGALRAAETLVREFFGTMPPTRMPSRNQHLVFA